MRLPKNRPPVHPGEILLEEFLKPMGVSQVDFARHIGWTTTKLSEIIKGKRGITPKSALQLGDVLGTSPGLWHGMQQDYDFWKAMQEHKPLPKLKVS